jgi:hypothetical protein
VFHVFHRFAADILCAIKGFIAPPLYLVKRFPAFAAYLVSEMTDVVLLAFSDASGQLGHIFLKTAQILTYLFVLILLTGFRFHHLASLSV